VGDTVGGVRLLRIADGKTFREMPGNPNYVFTLAFSQGGDMLVSCGAHVSLPYRADTVKVWSVADGTLVRQFTLGDVPGGTRCAVLSPDGASVAIGTGAYQLPAGWDDTVLGVFRVLDGVRTWTKVWVGEHMPSGSISYSPDGSQLALGVYGCVRVWRTTDQTEAYTLAHSGWIRALAYSPDGSAVCTGAWDDSEQVLRLWNASDGALIRAFAGASGGTNCLAFSPDGSVVADARERSGPSSNGGAVHWWLTADGTLSQTWDQPEDVGSGVKSLAFSPDGAYVAYVRSNDGAIVLARNPYGPPTGPPEETSMVVSNMTGKIGQTVGLAARLTALGVGVAGKTITFRVHGADAGSAVTDASGWAHMPYVVPEDGGVGNRFIEASFAGDASFAASDAAGVLMVQRTDTKLFTLDRSASSGDVCFLKGYLYRSTDRGWIGGRSLAFSVDGSQVGAAVTDTEGRAVLPYMVPEGSATGPLPIDVSWAGDADYYPSSTSSTLTVTKGALYIWVLQPRIASVGGSVYLRAYVRSWPGLNWKPGLPIVFSVEGTEVGTDVSNAEGRASVLYTVPAEMAPGDYPFTCDFPGNATYDPASGGGIVTVTP